MSKESAFEVGRLYVPLKTIADTLTASQKDVFIRLPGLISYYPMGIRDIAGNVRDHSGAGSTLSQVGVCPVGYDGNSFTHLGNGANYLQASTGFGVTGLETWISSSIRGLTIGGWLMIDTSPTTQAGIFSKDGPAPQRGYSLGLTTGDQPFFAASSTGAASVAAVGGVASIGVWHFFAGRFTPGAEVAIFSDGDKTVNTTAVPASINVSTQAFEVGRYLNDNNRVIHGKTRDVFVCASALSDALIEEVRVTSVP